MSFILHMNGVDICSLEELKQNLDIEKLLEHRHNFHKWLFGEDYEEEALAVKKLNTNLTNEQWLDAVAKICGFSNELEEKTKELLNKPDPFITSLIKKKEYIKEIIKVIEGNKVLFLKNYSQFDKLVSYISHPFFSLDDVKHWKQVIDSFSKDLIEEFFDSLLDIRVDLENEDNSDDESNVVSECDETNGEKRVWISDFDYVSLIEWLDNHNVYYSNSEILNIKKAFLSEMVIGQNVCVNKIPYQYSLPNDTGFAKDIEENEKLLNLFNSIYRIFCESSNVLEIQKADLLAKLVVGGDSDFKKFSNSAKLYDLDRENTMFQKNYMSKKDNNWVACMCDLLFAAFVFNRIPEKMFDNCCSFVLSEWCREMATAIIEDPKIIESLKSLLKNKGYLITNEHEIIFRTFLNQKRVASGLLLYDVVGFVNQFNLTEEKINALDLSYNKLLDRCNQTSNETTTTTNDSDSGGSGLGILGGLAAGAIGLAAGLFFGRK